MTDHPNRRHDDSRINTIAQDINDIKIAVEVIKTSMVGEQKLGEVLHTALAQKVADHEQRLKKVENWSVATKVAAFLGAGGTLGGLAKWFGL